MGFSPPIPSHPAERFNQDIELGHGVELSAFGYRPSAQVALANKPAPPLRFNRSRIPSFELRPATFLLRAQHLPLVWSPMCCLPSLRCLRWLPIALSLCLAALAEDQRPQLPTPPTIDPIQVMPAAAAAAEKLGIQVRSLEISLSESASPKIGDTITFAVDALKDRERREWLVQLVSNELKPEEKARVIPELHMFVNTGREVVFPKAEPDAIAIRILGPYREGKGDKGAKDIWSGALVNGQFLRLGLNGSPQLFSRLDAAVQQDSQKGIKNAGYTLTAGSKPFPPEVLEKGRVMAEHYKITEAEERALAGLMPAAIDFFTIAAQTTGVRDILFEIVDIPWWKLVANGGQIKDLHMEHISTGEVWPSEEWGLPPGGTVRGFGMLVYLFKKPAVLFRVIVATPRPPLQVSAGVLALAASRPDGKGGRLVLRMVGAKTP